MEKYKIQANEQFFRNVIRVLNTGGVWGWPATGEIFVKEQEKLAGSASGLKKVREIVSENFFKEFFVESKKD